MTTLGMTTPPDELPTPSLATEEPVGPLYCNDDELDYSNWGNIEPNNAFGNEDCVEVHVFRGVWNDIRCTDKNSYLCEKGTDIFCQ